MHISILLMAIIQLTQFLNKAYGISQRFHFLNAWHMVAISTWTWRDKVATIKQCGNSKIKKM